MFCTQDRRRETVGLETIHRRRRRSRSRAGQRDAAYYLEPYEASATRHTAARRSKAKGKTLKKRSRLRARWTCGLNGCRLR